MKYIDDFLNRITMYRVVLYSLTILACISIILGFTGVLSYGGWSQLATLTILIIVCYGANYFFAKLFKAPTNIESNFISAFILFFILSPDLSLKNIGFIILAGIFAMASKYVLAIRKRHIFNPSALGVFAIGLLGSGAAIWWVGSSTLLIPVAILGFFILRKVRRFTLFFAFFGASIATIGIVGLMHGMSLSTVLLQVFTSWPIIFFGTIMLTEPVTTPPTRKLQIAYGVLVGILFGSQFQIGPLYSTPELALLLGNIFAYIVSPKEKLFLRLKEKRLLAANTYEFIFENKKKFSFKPGQYFEWTLGHDNPDTRGNRRYFTIASSPTEADIKLGIRTTEVDPSSFKKALVALPPGGMIVAGSRSGEFVLPRDSAQKLVFISGGIGVTPFRSMIVSLLDSGEHRDIIHFYSNKIFSEIAYADILDRAKEVGVKTLYTLTDLAAIPDMWQGEKGFVDMNMIKKYVPDIADRVFYISGPRSMVVVFEKALGEIGVKKSNIKTDFFPGFA